LSKRRTAWPACLMPDAGGDECYPCPGTPAASDILQAVGALVAYAVDTCLTYRPRSWNCRRIGLSQPGTDGAAVVGRRPGCEHRSARVLRAHAEVSSSAPQFDLDDPVLELSLPLRGRISQCGFGANSAAPPVGQLIEVSGFYYHECQLKL
jgi:hypothetical protein